MDFLEETARDGCETPMVSVDTFSRSWVWFLIRSFNFFHFFKAFQPHYIPEVDSASYRNEFQKNDPGGWSTAGTRLTFTLPSVCWLCIKCGILDVTQPYRPSLPITGITSYLLPLLILAFKWVVENHIIHLQTTVCNGPCTVKCDKLSDLPVPLFSIKYGTMNSQSFIDYNMSRLGQVTVAWG